MMNGAIVSIIIPVYNTAPYLEECIESIICQTYKQWELILVDDGSEDASGEICERFCDCDKRISVIHKTNGGQGTARNYGLNRAVGKYIAFIDSDDVISPSVLEDNIVLFEQDKYKDVDIIQYPCIVKYGTQQASIKYSKDFVASGSENLYRAWLVDGLIANYVWGKIFRRELFKTIRFMDGTYFEDRHAMCFLLQECKSFLGSKRGLYYYRSRLGQVVQKPDSEFMLQSKINADLNIVRHTLPYPSLCNVTLERYSNCLHYGILMLKNHWSIRHDSIDEMRRVSFPFTQILKASVAKGIKFRCLLSRLMGPFTLMKLYGKNCFVC